MSLYAVPAEAQENDTHVSIGHDVAAEVSHFLTFPGGLTLSARIGAQDGSHINLGYGGGGCLIDMTACDKENLAGAAAALAHETLKSVGGAVGYTRQIRADTKLNVNATATWIETKFTSGAELRVTQDDFWVGYVAWHHDTSDAIRSALKEYDLQLGRAGVVRIGIGITF